MSKKEEPVEYIENADACPECGKRERIRKMQMGAAWAITCDDCGYMVGPFSLIGSAIRRWTDESKAAQARKLEQAASVPDKKK